jgi:hypothetical protein
MADDKEQVQSLSEFPVAIVLPKGVRDRLELALRDGIYSLRTWLQVNRYPAIKREQVVEFAYPKTAWQHFKMDYFPAWLRRAFPIEMEVVSKTVSHWDGPLYLCSHLSSAPEEKHRQFLATGVKNDSEEARLG